MERALRNEWHPAVTVAAPFNHQALTDLGFEFMGYCWGEHNAPYYQIDTELGYVCVVNYRDVYLSSRRDHLLKKIKSISQLNQFINLLETL